MIGTIGCSPGTIANPRAAHESDGVRIVHHHQRAVFFREITDAAQVGDGAVHREDAVGGDEPEARAAGFLQPRFEVGHVVVAVAQPLGLAESDAVDDRGVVQLVGNDGIVGPQQGLEQAAVGVEARGVEDRVGGA